VVRPETPHVSVGDSDLTPEAPDIARQGPAAFATGYDGRGSWIPTGAMILTRVMELRKRRGLMITLMALTIGIPVLFLVIRLLLHAFVPDSFGPAGGFQVFTSLIAGVLYVFAFIVAATLGATAGSTDLSDGMFTQLVVTGRSRVALYLARIPAGLAIVVPMVAIAFTVICGVCAFSAPTKFDFQGTTVPLGLSRAGYETWAARHPNLVVCDLPYNGPCPGNEAEPTAPMSRKLAEQEAGQNYASYAEAYVSPPDVLMIRTGLWLELEVIVAFVFGLGLASLIGERTLPIVMMIVYTVVLRPFLLVLPIPHLLNVQRSLVELAIAHLEPGGVGFVGSVAGGPGLVRDSSKLLPESRAVAVAVIVSWLVGWTVLGAWRMATRDA
jgi:hypothetical protein